MEAFSHLRTPSFRRLYVFCVKLHKTSQDTHQSKHISNKINTEIKIKFIKNKIKQKVPNQKTYTLIDLTEDLCQTKKKKELKSMFLELFRKIENERLLSNYFYKASITLMTQPNKDKMNTQKI